MLRQRLLIMGMLLLLCTAFSGCMKDDREVLPEERLGVSSPNEVRDFQAHFLEVYDEAKLRATPQDKEFTPLEFKGLRPLWDKAHVNKLGDDLELIEVPLSADELHVAIPQTLSIEELKKYQRKSYHISLIRERNLKTQKTKEFFLCYVPSSETLAKGLADYYHLLSLPKHFSGEMILFDLQLKPIYRYSIVDGYTQGRYLHADGDKEKLRVWIRSERCHVLMHENGWVVYVTPRRTETSYDPNNHYFTLECHESYEWLPDYHDIIVSSPSDYLNFTREKHSGASATLDKLYPVPLTQGLDVLVRIQDVQGMTSIDIAHLNDTYKTMLKEHPVHKRLDELLKSYPNLKKLKGIVLHPQSDKGSASINSGYTLNIYGKQYMTSKVLFHEWIHMAQMHKHNLFNKNGAGLDMQKFRERRGIMEFEGFLIRDVIKYVEGRSKYVAYHSEPFAIEGSGDKSYGVIYVDPDYEVWLDEITQKGTRYPNSPIDRVKFRKFARMFLETNRNYPISKYPLRDDLVYEPSLFDELFNNHSKEIQ